MANTIKIKNSGISNNAPTSLEFGELGLNYADGKIFFKNLSNTIVEFSTPPNFVVQSTAPANTSVIWADTSVTGVGVVPVGGTTGQVLSKGSNTSYDAVWANAITSSDLALKANIASPTFTGTVTIPAGASISGFAPLANAALTGTPTAPTATAATNTTQIATTAFVRTEVANLIASAPAALDTLDELAAALGDDANFATTTATAIGLKANIASPTFTGNVSGITATMVGLGNVTNTSDANKPVSTAQQTALDLKAPLASPTFTGTATFPNVTIDGASGTISSQGVGNFKTIASNGRGVGISGGTGDTPAILQFTNNAVSAQWGFISASSAGELTISGRILNTSVNIATGTPFSTTVNTGTSTNIATVSLTVKGGRPVLVMASGDANPSTNENAWNYLQLFRGETGIGPYMIQQTTGASNNQAFGIVALDPSPSAGTYTYSLRAWNGNGPLTYGETGAAQGPAIIALELL